MLFFMTLMIIFFLHLLGKRSDFQEQFSRNCRDGRQQFCCETANSAGFILTALMAEMISSALEGVILTVGCHFIQFRLANSTNFPRVGFISEDPENLLLYLFKLAAKNRKPTKN